MLADVFPRRWQRADPAVRLKALPRVQGNGVWIVIRHIQQEPVHTVGSCPLDHGVHQLSPDTQAPHLRCHPHRYQKRLLGVGFVSHTAHDTNIQTVPDGNEGWQLDYLLDQLSADRAAASSNVLAKASGASSKARRRIARTRGPSLAFKRSNRGRISLMLHGIFDRGHQKWVQGVDLPAPSP